MNKEYAMKAIDRMIVVLNNYRSMLRIIGDLLVKHGKVDLDGEEYYKKAEESIEVLEELIEKSRYYTIHDDELDNATMMNILNELRLRNTELYMAISTLFLKYGLDLPLPDFRGLL